MLKYILFFILFFLPAMADSGGTLSVIEVIKEKKRYIFLAEYSEGKTEYFTVWVDTSFTLWEIKLLKSKNDFLKQKPSKKSEWVSYEHLIFASAKTKEKVISEIIAIQKETLKKKAITPK